MFDAKDLYNDLMTFYQNIKFIHFEETTSWHMWWKTCHDWWLLKYWNQILHFSSISYGVDHGSREGILPRLVSVIFRSVSHVPQQEIVELAPWALWVVWVVSKTLWVATSTSDLLWETFQCFLTLDFAELTSVTKLEHFKCSNHINELTFWGLRFYSFSHRSEKKSDPKRWVGCLQNGDFALLWFLEKEWITIGCFQK